MRLIEVRVPADRLETVRSALESEGIDSIELSEGDDSDAAVLQFPVPTQAVDHVFDLLDEHGIVDDGYVVVLDAETARVPGIDDLEDRFVEGSEGEESIAAEEIRAKARDMHPDRAAYYGMTFLSAVVAAAGLLLDSPAIVVGSMVIAPQVGSALLASVGTALGDQKLLRTGILAQAAGLLLAVVSATAFGVVLRSTALVAPILDVTTVQQISQRISPGLLSLAVAICAGSAGAVGLATALPVSLVGVMIAAALIPAAAAVGLGVAWNLPAVAAGALVLLVVNTASINLAGVLTLWGFGYRPASRDRADGTDSQNLLPALAAVGLFLAVFAVAAVPMSQQIAYERDANRVVETTLADDRYDRLDLVELQVSYAGPGYLVSDRAVTVVVSRPVDRSYPDLVRHIRRGLAERTGDSPTVEVVYRDHQRASATPYLSRP